MPFLPGPPPQADAAAHLARDAWAPMAPSAAATMHGGGSGGGYTETSQVLFPAIARGVLRRAAACPETPPHLTGETLHFIAFSVWSHLPKQERFSPHRGGQLQL